MRIWAVFLVAGAALGARGAEERSYKLPRAEKTNVVDEARFSLAEELASRGEFRRAAPALEEIASKSPDEGARSAAHLGLAKLWNELGENERSEEELAKVGGRLAARAVRELVLRELRDGEFDAAAEKLLSFLERARDPFARASAARQLIRLVRGKGLDGERFLKRLCGLLSYDEAEALAKAEGELEAGKLKYVERLKEEVARLRKRGLWEEAMRLAGKLKMPKVRKAKGLREKLERLEEEGRFEEARKLKEKLGRPVAPPEPKREKGPAPPDEEF